jgi:hypothetical protein
MPQNNINESVSSSKYMSKERQEKSEREAK